MIGEVTFGVIGLLFLLADVRTFASTFQQSFFGAPNTNLAVMATAVFATSFLGLLVAWRFRPARALGTSGVVFAVATVLLTASRHNWVDLGLAVIALAAGFWWLAFLHSARVEGTSSPLAVAVPIAFAADLALRSLFRTVAAPDLAWPTAFGLAIVGLVVFGAAGLVTIAPPRQWTGPDLRGALGLLALPALLLVAETGGTNGAQAALAAGWGLGPEPAGATQTGAAALGAGLAVGLLSAWRLPLRGPIAALLLAGGAALLWAHLPYASLVGGAVLAAACVLAAPALLGGRLRPSRAPISVVVALSVGWLLFVGAAFGFYAFWAYYPALWAATAFVVLATLVAPIPRVRPSFALTLAGCLLAVGAPLAARAATPAPADVEAARNTFRLMTYNIHQGFNAGQIPSLDELAGVIGAESPDVLCLQEVARGWMVDEGHDSLSVLAERLGMRYAWFPAIGDLYGDAILSRFEMTDVKRVRYAIEPGAKHQPRGAISVKTSGVTIVCTHLDDVSDSTSVRQEQVRTILREWIDVTPIAIAGDMNGTPDSIEIRLYDQSGFDDLGADAGPTTTMDDPQKRIDYVFGRGLIGGQAHTVPLDVTMRASDHRGLVVNVTISK